MKGHIRVNDKRTLAQPVISAQAGHNSCHSDPPAGKGRAGTNLLASWLRSRPSVQGGGAAGWLGQGQSDEPHSLAMLPRVPAHQTVVARWWLFCTCGKKPSP